MNEKSNTFRVNTRFNRIEFADLERDLDQYKGTARAGRIRLLVRLGLAVANGTHVPSTSADRSAHLAAVIDLPRTKPVEKPATKQLSAEESVDFLESIGMDPANFKFGQKKS
jgi:hypothetical protein